MTSIATLALGGLALMGLIPSAAHQTSHAPAQTASPAATMTILDEGRPAAEAIAKALPGHSVAIVEDPNDPLRKTMTVFSPNGVAAGQIALVSGRIVSVRTPDGTFPRPRDTGQLIGWISNGASSPQY
jgi:hypothetical protein